MPRDLNILVIEDNTLIQDALRIEIEAKIARAKVHCSRFDGYKRRINELDPEAIVLDLYEGNPSEGARSGEDIWKEIWERRFTPLIIHSARADEDLSPMPPDGHNFIKRITKNATSSTRVASELKKFKPYFENFRSVRKELNDMSQKALREVTEVITNTAIKKSLRKDAYLRSARRRLGALVDLATLTGDPLLSWEQYILPPLGDELLTGDLIRLRTGGRQSPGSYRLVLSPSCDMVQARGNHVKEVLVAQCFSPGKYVQKCNIGDKNTAQTKIRDKLKPNLTQAHINGLMMLPGFDGIIPQMSVSLKDLALIPIEKIGTAQMRKKFVRIASIDSPFREQVSWAFTAVCGRPGIPDRDVEEWAAKIAREYCES